MDVHNGRLNVQLLELLIRIHINIVLEGLRQRQGTLVLVLGLMLRQSGTVIRVQPRDCNLEVVDYRSKLLRGEINICAYLLLGNDVPDQCLRPCVLRAM